MRVLTHATVVVALTACSSPAPRPSSTPPPTRPSEPPPAGIEPAQREHPYVRQLTADLAGSFVLPSLVESTQGVTMCLRLAADGKVGETKLDPRSGNAQLDEAAERALARVSEKRAASPEPIPGELAGLDARWLCYPFGARAP
jgi:hypothetical protein